MIFKQTNLISLTKCRDYLQDSQYRRSYDAIRKFLKFDKADRVQKKAPQFDGAFPSQISSLLLSDYAGKCAFCDLQVPREELSLHPYRPPWGARPFLNDQESSAFYIWASLTPKNYFPICRDCTPEDPFDFPMLGTGLNARRMMAPENEGQHGGLLFDELLNLGPEGIYEQGQINPDLFKEDAALFFPGDQRISGDAELNAWYLQEDGKLIGEIAATTIEHFKLNRAALVAERAKKIQLLQQGDVPAQVLLRQTDEDLRKEPLGEVVLLFRRQDRRFDQFTARVSPAKRRPERKRAEGEEEKFDITINSPKRLKVQNFLSLSDVEIAWPTGQTSSVTTTAREPAPALALLGENGVGKSTVLAAMIAALIEGGRENVEHHLGQDLTTKDSHFFRKHAKQEAAENGDKLVPAVSLTLRGDPEREFKLDEAEPIGLRPIVLAYSASRSSFSEEDGFAATSEQYENFFIPTNLPDPYLYLEGLVNSDDEEDRKRLDRLVACLEPIMQIDGEFDSLNKVSEGDLAGELCLKITSEDDETLPRFVPLRHASTGYKSVFSLVVDMFRHLDKERLTNVSMDNTKAFILIDEPEAHLHPRWKIQIIRALRQSFPGVYFVFATHDPLCLRGMSSEEIYIMRRDLGPDGNERIVARRPRFDPNMLNVEQLLMTEFFDLDQTTPYGNKQDLYLAPGEIEGSDRVPFRQLFHEQEVVLPNAEGQTDAVEYPNAEEERQLNSLKASDRETKIHILADHLLNRIFGPKPDSDGGNRDKDFLELMNAFAKRLNQ